MSKNISNIKIYSNNLSYKHCKNNVKHINNQATKLHVMVMQKQSRMIKKFRENYEER